MATTLPARNEVNPDYTWNAESLFATPKDWETEVNDILADLPELKKFQGILSESASRLADALQVLGMTWARFGHLYRDYYVFQYATGIPGAQALANRVLRGEAGAVEAYLTFLKSGSSGYPLDLLKKTGVDLTSTEPVEEAFDLMADYVDRLENLLK